MIKKFLRDESGLELSEYAVAAALVAVAAVVAFQTLGTTISGKIEELIDGINGETGAGAGGGGTTAP